MRRAANGIAKCLRAASTEGLRASSTAAVCRNGRQHASCTATFPSLSGCATGNNNLTTAAFVPSAYHSRRFSSKASSDEPSGAAADSEAESGSSPGAESTPLNTLVSSDGASPSLLTGPRITSKKGYLERESMIRETQKAVREYYKEGMYQVRGQVDFSVCKCCTSAGCFTCTKSVMFLYIDRHVPPDLRRPPDPSLPFAIETGHTPTLLFMYLQVAWWVD